MTALMEGRRPLNKGSRFLCSAALFLSATALVLLQPWRQQGVQQAANSHPPSAVPAALPADFDWEAYQFYSPELALGSEAAARAHYAAVGWREGRPYRRVRTTLRYEVSGGLCNQMVIHLTMLTLAAALRADVALPPAQCRQTYAHRKGYRLVPPSTLLDLPAMAAHWGGRGVRVYAQGEGAGCLAAKVPKLARMNTVENATRAVATIVRSALRPTLAVGPQNDSLCVHLAVTKPYLLLNGTRAVPQITDAARGLLYAPEIVQLAEQIAGQLGRFVGLHLRIEGDWMERWQNPQEDFVGAMRRAGGYDSNATLYVASGVFGYLRQEEIDRLIGQLREQGVFGRLVYKEQLLPQAARQGLHSEQLALVDLLVLARAERVVGHCLSSFSKYLQELRALRGVPKASATFVTTPQCTDPAFAGENNYRAFHWGWVFTPP